MWTYSYTALQMPIPIHKANLLKILLKVNSHFKPTLMCKNVSKIETVKWLYMAIQNYITGT